MTVSDTRREKVTNWNTGPMPKLQGYFFATPKDSRDWLCGIPEVVYVYFDGKWSVIRPGESRGAYLNDFTHWLGPIVVPEAPEGTNDG